MPLHIDRVQTEMEISPDAVASRDNAKTVPGLDGRSQASDAVLKERLRPIVIEIIQEELDKLRRQQGRA